MSEHLATPEQKDAAFKATWVEKLLMESRAERRRQGVRMNRRELEMALAAFRTRAGQKVGDAA